LLGRLVYQATSAIGSFLCAMRAGRPDIILAMGAPPTSALLGLLLARLRRVPLVLDVRDIPLETALELDLVHPKSILRVAMAVEKMIFRRADRCICVSDEMADFVRRRGVPAEKIFRNYIGYDNFDNLSDSSDCFRVEILNRLDPETECIVFYAGTLAKLVDISTLLRAAEHVKENRKIGFVIVGDGEQKIAYQNKASSQKLNIFFSGRIPKEKVHALCAISDICIYPLKGGPATAAMLGNKIFDYLGAGKPVVYTGPDGAVPRLIERVQAGFVLSEGDDIGLAHLLQQFTKSPGAFYAAGSRGRAAVMKEMTAAHSSHELAVLLAETLHTKNSRK
jgi:glycosyltransferase involved in cell wall biosynthesis